MHTSGTHQAQHFDMNFQKIIDVPFVCHMCADHQGAYYRFKIKKFRQFPFECRVARQNRTFLARCGSLIRFAKNHGFGGNLMFLTGGWKKR